MSCVDDVDMLRGHVIVRARDWGLGFEVRGLRFGVWGLGFGGWNKGL